MVALVQSFSAQLHARGDRARLMRYAGYGLAVAHWPIHYLVCDEVLVLFEIEGYSGDEIARLLEIPVATVWTRLHHARKALLAQLQRERGDSW